MHLLTGRALAAALVLSTFLLPLSTFPQRPPAQPNAAEILHKMQKLQVLGSVLYIAAHPDDENTRLIAWLANGKKVRTGYLSLTRGEGGQNLVGPELGDGLGIIRTQELLEARRIDGGEQFFTRAVDFGYSKSAEESFEKWGKQEVLSDVVRVIRMFRPDVIITRFNTDGGGGHGHHTASAILAQEAFDLAGDPNAFPEQLEQGLEVWQPRRLFWNASTFWRKDLAEYVKKDSTGEWYSVDVGGYDPLLGLSYTEIAGRSRSMHKSQGFGAAETRGEMIEYLHLEKGDKPRSKDIFEGIDIGLSRVTKKTQAQRLLDLVMTDYRAVEPHASVKTLLDLRVALWSPSEGDYGLRKWQVGRVDDLIRDCLGISVEYVFEEPFVLYNQRPDSSRLFIVTNRSPIDLYLDTGHRIKPEETLKLKGGPTAGTGFILPSHWLEEPHGDFRTSLPWESIRPVKINPAKSTLTLHDEHFDDDYLEVESFAIYKWIDRVAGERIRPVYETPVACVIPKNDVLFAHRGPQQVVVEVEALTDILTGQLNVTMPDGWSTTKDLKLVNIAKRNERQAFTFQLVPTENAKAVAVKFEFTGPKGKADRTLHEIDYPHIMPQVYYTPAEVKLIPLDVKVNANTVGYIKGAGDDVPRAIEQLGVKVEMIDAATATLESLSKYDAIVTGIRAYNTNQAMKDLNPLLMKYVENGGTLVCQYNTRSNDMVLPDSLFGPYPFKLTRDRVTVEEAPPNFLVKDHPLLNTPNKITTADFDGWVQERGLYFCGSLDPHYTPLIAWNDPGEEPLSGGLISCEYGKGRYVYTGISFFRQLPAGVPGAYRLFANLISKREWMKNGNEK